MRRLILGCLLLLPAALLAQVGINVNTNPGGTGTGSWITLSNNSLANFNASDLPVTYGNVTSGSNTVTVLSAASWVNGEGIYIPAVSSDAGSPNTGVTCDHVTVSGNTLTMLTSGGSACNAGWTSSENSLPILHYKMTNGSITSGTNSLSLTSATTFSSGQGIRVAGAGSSGADLSCPKITVSGTTATLFQANGSTACNASTTVSGGAIYHDDTQAVANAVAAGGPVYAPSGSYYLSSETDLPNGTTFYGDGLQNSIFVVDKDALNAVVLKSSGITVRDLALIASEDFTPTSGNLLSFCDGTSTCYNDIATRLQLYGGWTTAQILNKAYKGSFTYSTITNPKHAVIYLNNPVPYGDMSFTGLKAQPCSTAGCSSAVGIDIDAADANAWNDVKMNGFVPNLLITGNLGQVDHQRFDNVSFEGTGNLAANGYSVDIEKKSTYAVGEVQFTGGEVEINQANANGFYLGAGVQGVQINGIHMWGEGSASSSTWCIDSAASLVTITGNDISQCGDAIRLESGASNTTITGNLLYTTSGWGINALGSGSGLSQTSNVFSSNTGGTENLGSSGPVVVANWYMNDGSGSTFVNQIAANNATASNVTWTSSAGFPGSVATFNGTSSTAVAASATPTSFSNTQPFSACWWVKPTTLSTQVFLSNATATTLAGWQMDLDSSGDLGFYLINNFGSGNYINVTVATAVATSTLQQICVTYDGSSHGAGIAIYVNGASKTVIVNTDALTSTSASTQALTIGSAVGGGNYYGGPMGDAEVWSAALSSTQISSLYAAGPQ